MDADMSKESPDAGPTQHAFVMLGKETLFLCHLTMFHDEQHRFQIVLRAQLPAYAMAAYLGDFAAHPNETYFLGNSEQDLITMPELQSGLRTSFIADIFRGIPQRHVYRTWPWKHEVPVVKSVRLTVERVVYSRHFDFNLNYPDTLTYVVFGSGTEAHLTHYQVKEPDYDHVLSLKAVPSWLPAIVLEAGVHLNFPALKTGDTPCENPLRDGEHDVHYAGMPPVHRVIVGPTRWFSTKIVNAVDPCAGS